MLPCHFQFTEAGALGQNGTSVQHLVKVVTSHVIANVPILLPLLEVKIVPELQHRLSNATPTNAQVTMTDCDGKAKLI